MFVPWWVIGLAGLLLVLLAPRRRREPALSWALAVVGWLFLPALVLAPMVGFVWALFEVGAGGSHRAAGTAVVLTVGLPIAVWALWAGWRGRARPASEGPPSGPPPSA